MTTNNPILDELHAVREKMLADAGGTLAGLVAKIQADQAKSGRVVLKSVKREALHPSDGDEHSDHGAANIATR